MTTLSDYANQHFPAHLTEGAADVALTSHTAVAHVVGRETGARMEALLVDRLPPGQVAAVTIERNDPTVVNRGGEDQGGIVDLPYRRIAIVSIVGAAVGGGAVGVLVGAVAGSLAVGLVIGAFCAVIGAVVGGMLAGGGRHAGERAWEQPHAPDRTIVVVAALLDTEADATAMARLMEELRPEEVRIVNTDGAWHSPHD